jgi:hypothetical protein
MAFDSLRFCNSCGELYDHVTETGHAPDCYWMAAERRPLLAVLRRKRLPLGLSPDPIAVSVVSGTRVVKRLT